MRADAVSKVLTATRTHVRTIVEKGGPGQRHRCPGMTSQPQFACHRRFGRELLDIDTLSANPLARRATPVASDVIGERLRRGAGWAQALPLKVHGSWVT